MIVGLMFLYYIQISKICVIFIQYFFMDNFCINHHHHHHHVPEGLGVFPVP